MTLRTLNYGNYGIFLIMGNAGFCPSTGFLRIQVSVAGREPRDDATSIKNFAHGWLSNYGPFLGPYYSTAPNI